MRGEESGAGLSIVSVSSSSKKAGKTTLSAYLMRELPGDYGLKVCADHHVPPIMEDMDIIAKPGTDTGALVEAGARKVVWASSRTPEGLARVVPQALGLFPGRGVLIVEGNSALLHLVPDFAIFVTSVAVGDFKPSALEALPLADLIMLDMRWSLQGRDVREVLGELRKIAPGARALLYRDACELREAFPQAARIAREALARPRASGLLVGEGAAPGRM